MKPEDFKIGDVVKLTSYSPEMTVKSVDENIITCTYYCKSKFSFETVSFDFEMLKKV